MLSVFLRAVRTPYRAFSLYGKSARIASYDGGDRACKNGDRYSSRRHDRGVFLHRSRHGRGDRRNGDDRQQRETVSGRNDRVEEFPRERRRIFSEGRETAPRYFRRRGDLCGRHRSRRQHPDRKRRGDRRQRLGDSFCGERKSNTFQLRRLRRRRG